MNLTWWPEKHFDRFDSAPKTSKLVVFNPCIFIYEYYIFSIEGTNVYLNYLKGECYCDGNKCLSLCWRSSPGCWLWWWWWWRMEKRGLAEGLVPPCWHHTAQWLADRRPTVSFHNFPQVSFSPVVEFGIFQLTFISRLEIAYLDIFKCFVDRKVYL